MLRDAESGSDVISRKFGYCDILWEIENYISATCKKDWTIASPEFIVRGSRITKWKLLLRSKYKNNKYLVHTYLERTESDPVPDTVQVKWKLIYFSGELQFGMSELKGSFDRSTSFNTDISDIDIIEQNMAFFSSNPLSVRCIMIVYDKDSARYDIPNDLGLKSLSQDMTVLYRLNKHFDVTWNIGNNIRAHRAILCSRNRVLKSLIARNGDNLAFDFPWMKAEAAENLVAFLYTGNLDYVLRTPSFSMHQMISYFKINELQLYYGKDELTMRTAFDTQEIDFRWIIQNISAAGTDILSPEWRLEMFSASFQLKLQFDETDQISIYGDFIGGAPPKEIHIVCAVFDEKNNFRNMKVKAWTSESNEKLGFADFLSKASLIDPLYHIHQNSMGIICKLRIPFGTQTSSDYHYDRLSKDLEILFESGSYSDFEMVSRGIRYKVHRVILSTRSHVLDKIIKDLELEKTLYVSDIDPYVLRIVLLYIYSGKINNYSIGQIIKVYAVAEKCTILALKYACSRILQENIQLQNLLEILLLAHGSKDFKLQFSVFKFIVCNEDEVRTNLNWLSFLEENPSISREFQDFYRKINENL